MVGRAKIESVVEKGVGVANANLSMCPALVAASELCGKLSRLAQQIPLCSAEVLEGAEDVT